MDARSRGCEDAGQGVHVPERFLDPGVGVWDLGPTETDPWLVVCPQCARRAVLKRDRLVCVHCGLDRISPSRDYALWLSTPCCGDVLSANNERHLALLEGYILATQRARRPDAQGRWHNQSLLSRLPRWLKAAGNREELTKGLARLRARLQET